MDKMNLWDNAGVNVVRAPKGELEPTAIAAKGKFRIQQIRDGKVINEFDAPNGIVNVGKDKLLNVMFHSDTQITSWYIGLVDNAGFSAFAAADTMGSHSGWAESTAYSESTRNAWGPGASSGQSITNGTAVTFTMNATATIKGIFVTSDSTKGGTAGTLWSTAAFTSTVSVNNGDLLKVTYTVSA